MSMASLGDVDGDGIPDVAVGASGDDLGVRRTPTVALSTSR